MAADDDRGPSEIKIGVRSHTKAKFDTFASRKRLKLVEVADLAIDALNSLPKTQQDALIERRQRNPAV